MTPQHTFYKTDGLYKKIIVDDIVYLEADSNYTYLHTLKNGVKNKITIRATLDTTLRQLPQHLFGRANRSEAIALRHIDKIKKDSIIYYYDKEQEMGLTRQFYDEFMAKLIVLEADPAKIQLPRRSLPVYGLSQKNVLNMFFDINNHMEANAQEVVNMIFNHKLPSLLNPGPADLTEAEKEALNLLPADTTLKSAMTKLLIDYAAGIVANHFKLLDGKASPSVEYERFTGLQLVDLDSTPGAVTFNHDLHSAFLEVYSKWPELKGEQVSEEDVQQQA